MCKRYIDGLPLLGTWPAAQACALTGNQTSHALVSGPRSIHQATPARVSSLSLKAIESKGIIISLGQKEGSIRNL